MGRVHDQCIAMKTDQLPYNMYILLNTKYIKISLLIVFSVRKDHFNLKRSDDVEYNGVLTRLLFDLVCK